EERAARRTLNRGRRHTMGTKRIGRGFLALFCALALFGMAGRGARAAEPDPADPYAGETTQQRDARMKWWREARFGMFIHWGVYSVPAGTYHAKRIGSIGEWIMNTAKTPTAEYQQYAKELNPVKHDAAACDRTAEAAALE